MSGLSNNQLTKLLALMSAKDNADTALRDALRVISFRLYLFQSKEIIQKTRTKVSFANLNLKQLVDRATLLRALLITLSETSRRFSYEDDAFKKFLDSLEFETDELPSVYDSDPEGQHDYEEPINPQFVKKQLVNDESLFNKFHRWIDGEQYRASSTIVGLDVSEPIKFEAKWHLEREIKLKLIGVDIWISDTNFASEKLRLSRVSREPSPTIVSSPEISFDLDLKLFGQCTLYIDLGLVYLDKDETKKALFAEAFIIRLLGTQDQQKTDVARSIVKSCNYMTKMRLP